MKLGSRRRGCGKTVCTRGSNRAAARGPSTSPLEVHFEDWGLLQIRQAASLERPGSAALAALDTGGFDPTQQARAAAGSDPFRGSSPLRQRLRSRQYFFDGTDGARANRSFGAGRLWLVGPRFTVGWRA